ncbi:MAG: hypothetical protein HFJ84_00575 [Clostridiales bacterium]|nr:hypothetical protein [Clostridiales bacterium]
MTYVLIALPLVALIASVIFAIRSVKRGKKTRSAVATQLLAFLAVAVVTFAVPMVASAAEDEAPAEGTTTSSEGRWAGFLAAGAVTGISGIGGGMAVAAAAPAAIGATSEDPKAFGKALIFVALGEGVALYGLLISILILNKV